MMNQNQQATNLPIDRKMLLSIREAAEYSNIGIKWNGCSGAITFITGQKKLF